MGNENEVTIEQMAEMLSDEKPAAPAVPAEQKPPAEPAGDAAQSGDAETKADAVEKPASPDEKGDDKPSESGADTKRNSEEPKEGEEKSKGKFTPKPEAPDAVQKRINKAIWEKHEADRRREAAEREAAELRKKLEENNQAPGKPAAAATADKPATANFTEPEPPPPKEDDFDTLNDFLKAHATHIKELSAWQYRKERFEDRQRIQAEESERAQSEREKAAAEASAKWTERVVKYAEAKPQINEALSHVGPFLTQAGQADYIMQSEVGLEIVAYLHDHAEEAIKMAQTGDPIAIARGLGRIEAQILSSRTSQKPNPETLSPDTELPDPVAAVGGRATPSKGVDLSDESISMEDFSREFRRQIEAAP